MSAGASLARPVYLTREGEVFRLSFPYRADLVERVRQLPYASFDQATKSWICQVCDRSVELLRGLYYDGLTDVAVDALLVPGETLVKLRDARLRAGTTKRPFVVHMAARDDRLYARLRAVPGAEWDKGAQGVAYPPSAAAALAELVERGVLDDPERLLSPADVTVTFDGRTGRFKVLGDDRAAPVFSRFFPDKDVVAIWRERGLDVDFSDSVSEEIYRGEIARRGEGIQPRLMTAPLYPYQARDVAIAVERSGFAVLHAPGVGKTNVAIGTGCELLDRGEVTRVVIVCPSAIRTQLRNEIVRFTSFGIEDVVVVGGTKAQRDAAYLAARDASWFIVHYDVLSRDQARLKPLFDGALLVCDEAHKLKNPSASRTKALRSLARGAARRLVMTGTPVENSPGEWYSVLGQVAMPGIFGSPMEFLNRYQFPSRFGGFEGARNIGELRERSRYHYSRWTKAQVAEHLPPLTVQQVVLDPDPAYAAALKRAHAQAREEIARGRVEQVTAVARKRGEALLDAAEVAAAESGAEMTAVGMLRAMCSSPRLLAASSSEAAKRLAEAGLLIDADGPKLDQLRSICGELQVVGELRRSESGPGASPAEVAGERVVIFTYSRTMAELISERFTEDGIRHATYHGNTSQKERDAAVARFTDPEADITALVCTDAAAEGLNLGTCCNLLIQVDVPWNPSTAIQRYNRIHRIDGTADRYTVINLTVAGTIEHGILKLLERKANLADQILGESGGVRATVGARGSLGDLLKEAFGLLDESDPAAGRARAPRRRKPAAPEPEPAVLGSGSEADASDLLLVSPPAPELAREQAPEPEPPAPKRAAPKRAAPKRAARGGAPRPATGTPRGPAGDPRTPDGGWRTLDGGSFHPRAPLPAEPPDEGPGEDEPTYQDPLDELPPPPDEPLGP
jgi:superfamily II DNA or RNA helicase